MEITLHNITKARIFLIVDLREFFSDLRSRGTEKEINKKSSENDQLTGHFQSFFIFNISRNNSKTK